MKNEKLNNCVTDLEGEVWKVINHPSIGDYSNYEISNKGRIKSKRGNKEKLLKVQKNKKTDYFQVCLCINGVQRMFRLNRLVALMFIPNPDNLPCVNHIDEDKNNNCVSNLEWCTQQYNLAWGKGGKIRKEKLIKLNAKKSKQVYQYTTDGTLALELVNVYPSTKEVERQTGFDNSLIGKCCNGKRKSKTAYNFIWSYEPLTETKVS